MNKIVSKEQERLLPLLHNLRKALNKGDKKEVVRIFSITENIDFNLIDSHTCSVYEQLVSEADMLLYTA